MRAARMVAQWCDFYTRNLEPATAETRRDELASDVFEQLAHDPKAGRAIVSRALRGVPADLAWRHEQLRAARPPVAMSRRVLGGGVGALTAGAASALIALGVFALLRPATLSAHDPVDNGPWILGLTLLASIGAFLLLRNETRTVGALTLAASTPLVHFVNVEFGRQSVTASELALVSEWGLAVWCLIACLACVFLSAAILWFPQRKDAS